jgi:hypothetical protein
MANNEPVDLDAPILPDDSSSDTSVTDENWLDDAEAEESTPAEDNEDTSEDTDKESDDSSEEAKTEEDEESTDDSEEQSDEDKTEETPDQKEQARQRYLERQSRRNEADPYVESIKKEADERLSAIEDETQRKLAQLEVKDRLREIQDARTSLITDHEFAQRDFDVFNPKSDSYDEKVYDHFLQDYERAYLVKDPESGEVLGTKGPSLYQYLSDKAELIASLKQTGARENQKSKAKMKSQAETPSVAAPKAPKTDAFAEAFDSQF